MQRKPSIAFFFFAFFVVVVFFVGVVVDAITTTGGSGNGNGNSASRKNHHHQRRRRRRPRPPPRGGSTAFYNRPGRGKTVEADDDDEEAKKPTPVRLRLAEDEDEEEGEPPKKPSSSSSYGRIGPEEYRLTPEQIDDFRERGCCTLPDVLTEEEVSLLEEVFDRFLRREIPVPGRDFCDMSKPFDAPFESWSIVNCMLPTTYHPPLRDNVYEKITSGIVKQLFDDDIDDDDDESYESESAATGTTRIRTTTTMTKDYDQFLSKRPGKTDAVFAWHQDMGYWPSSETLGLGRDHPTSTATFSLAIDDSSVENGCLRYVPGSQKPRSLRSHVPLIRSSTSTSSSSSSESGGGGDREEGHALTIEVDESVEEIAHAPAKRGSVTIHDEYVVHGSGGNALPDKQRRTYVLAYRLSTVVDAERSMGFTHSHNDVVNWDTFRDDTAKKDEKDEGKNKNKDHHREEEEVARE